MVNVKDIEKIITDIINNSSVNVKCGPTISEMHGMLNSISYEDQYKQLKEKGLLNPLEVRDFQEKINLIEEFEHVLNNPNNNAKDKEFAQKQLDEIHDELFLYGRRLIEGIKYKETPQIDKSKFQSDEQWGGHRMHNFEWSHEHGEIEEAQIQSQKNSLNIDASKIFTEDGMKYNMDTFEGKSVLAMDNYFNGDSSHINYTISNEGYIKALDKEQRNQMKNIDSLMDKSLGLQQDTILYRAGHFNIHLKEGDSFKFKGYVSTTFQEATSEIYKESGEEYDMTYVIHAPKGTKGICGGDDTFHNNNWEHEYVLPRNTKFTVLSIDYDTMTCEVVIEE